MMNKKVQLAWLKKLLVIVNLPFRFFRLLISTLPNTISELSTLQRIWFILSLPVFYSAIYFGIASLASLLINDRDLLEFFMAFLISLFLPAGIYYGVVITFKVSYAFVGFIFEKDSDRIKNTFKALVNKMDSQTILRYLLIVLVMVVIVIVIISAISKL